LINLEILDEASSIKLKVGNKPRYIKKFFDNKYTLYFFGFFRTPISLIESNINCLTTKEFTNKNLEKIFKEINGICTIVIETNDKIQVCTSIYHAYLKIFKSKFGFVITDSEFNGTKKISSNSAYLKLLSHHSYFFHEGISDNVLDFIPQGGVVTFYKKNLNDYKFSWYLDFEKFCSRDDHDKIVDELTEKYLGVFDYLEKDKEYYFGLSGGLDSAVALSAAIKKKIKIKPFHVCRGMYDDELNVAEGVSKFLGSDLKKIYKYNKKITPLNDNDNITENLEYNYNFIKKDSIFFFSHHFISNKNFYNSHVFTGTGDPLLLTINHFMVYSDRIRKNFGYEDQKDKRYFYSLNFFKELENKINKSSYNTIFKNIFTSIDARYIPLFESFIDQLTKQFDFRSKYLGGNQKISSREASPIKNLNNEQCEIMKELKVNRATSIINKVIECSFFKDKLKKYDARSAQILLKFFHFLGQYGKENHQTSMMHDKTNIVEFVAMNTSIALSHLSVLIDERLVNYSKWHCFKVFEKINGKQYEEIYRRPSLMNPKFVLQRLHSKLRSKVTKIPENDDNFMFVNNKSLHEFIKKKGIIEKYNDYKSTHQFKDLLYEFPNRNDLLKLEDTTSNLWKINNIINLVNKIE
jgi:hypothetical protein